MRTRAIVVLVILLATSIPTPQKALSDEPPSTTSGPSSTPTTTGPAATRVGYGLIVSNLNNLDKVQALGFNWVKLSVSWRYSEPSKGAYNWGGLDSAVSQALSKNLNILLRVDDSPSWATGTNAFNAPPLNDQDLADFMYALASRYRGSIKGYEIWNEPNLNVEWGYQYPSPAKYGQMLKALYPRVKQADPDAKVVTGGLSNVGDGNGTTVYGDLLYIKDLYDPNGDGNTSDGAKGYFDAIGSHPYGGPNPPEQDPWNPPPPTGTYFRRAWQHHQMAEVWGQEDREIWITEFGWLLDPAEEGRNCDAEFGSHFVRFKVSGSTQADYTVRAYQYAENNWPWAGPMILMNLDLSQDSWRSGCEVVQYYSILRGDGSPRPVYTALMNMPKPGLTPSPSLSATSLYFLVEPGTTSSRSIQLTNSGGGTLTWSASSSAQLWLRVSPTSGTAPSTLVITVDTSTLPAGTYYETITINIPGASPGTINIPVFVYVGPVSRSYLPVLLRGSSN